MGMVADSDGLPFVNACTRTPPGSVTSVFYIGARAHVHARCVHKSAVDLGAAYACTVSEEVDALGGGKGGSTYSRITMTCKHTRAHTLTHNVLEL